MSKLKVWKDIRGKWRWKLTARNGMVIGASTQGYRHKSDCEKNIRQVAKELDHEERQG